MITLSQKRKWNEFLETINAESYNLRQSYGLAYGKFWEIGLGIPVQKKLAFHV